MFIVPSGLSDANDSCEKALIPSLGSEGQRILRNLGPAPAYSGCVALLTGHFSTQQSIMLRRIVFHRWKKQVGKSIHNYVADLKGLASLCKFGALEDELIRAHLVEHINNAKLR